MSLEKFKEFLSICEEHKLTKSSYEVDGIKFFYEKKTDSKVINSQPFFSSPNEFFKEPITAAMTPSKGKDNHQPQDPNITELKSPFVGTFYTSSAPGKPSFVKVGQKIKTGQTLCILEAMKVMNEIESECDGEIVEVCLENESFVEFGQTLFKIRKF